MTDEEIIQEAVARTIASLKTNGKTVAQLTAVNSYTSSDYVELNGGRRIALTAIQAAVVSAIEADLDNMASDITGMGIEYFSVSTGPGGVGIGIKQAGHEMRYVTIPAATDEKAGVMTAADKEKLDGMDAENLVAVVDLADIDDLKTADCQLATTPTRYAVKKTTSRGTVVVALLDILSDDMRHVVTQVITTHYVIENGVIDTSVHRDGELFRYYRSCKVSGGTLPVDAGEWTPWKPFVLANVEIFGSLSAIEGKTAAQKAAMLPDGNAVEETANFFTTLAGTSYTNRIINENGASVQPSSSNGNRLVVVFDISQLVGQKIDFSSYNNYASAYSWAVWRGNTKVSLTGLSQNTDVRVMSEATSAKGGYTGHITVEEGDRFLALVGYSSHDTDAKASIAVKEVVSKNAEAVKQNKEDITAVNTYTRSYSPVATYPNRIINASGASVQPSSSNGNRLVVVFDISQLVGQTISFSGYNNYSGTYSWSVLRDGTTWGTTGNTYNTDTRLVSGTTSAAGRYTDSVEVQPGDKWLALVNYNNYAVRAENTVSPLGDKIREFDGIANPEDVKEYNPMSAFALKVKNLSHSAGVKPLVLAHFSDIHGNGTALSRLLSWCGDYSNLIDDILHTGDAVESKYSDGMAFWNGAGAESVLNIIGNHDASTSSDGNGGKSQAECYDQYIAPYVENWGVVQPDGVDDETSAEYKACYWYKDYAEKNVRLIALDCMVKATGTAEQVEAQLAWLETVLLDAAENNMTVVAAYHSHPLSGGYERVECPFSHMTAGNVGAYNWPAAAQMIADFVNNSLTGQVTAGKFACWLCGHQHKDVVVWYDAYGQLSIAIDSMSLSVSARDISGKGQDCFNLIAIDTSYHIVKLLRVGNDCDAQMRHIGMCSVDYTTGKVVGHQDISGKEDRVAVASISGTWR